MRILALTLALLSMALFSACTKKSEPGGPGAAQGPAAPAEPSVEKAPGERAQEATTEARPEDLTFTLHVPRTATSIKQSSSDQVKVSIDRGARFNQAVMLKFEAPKGLTVTPDSAKLEAGQTETEITVAAAADAPVGRQQIHVTATPESGKAVDMMLDIDVKEQ
jgi:hypothetical protein